VFVFVVVLIHFDILIQINFLSASYLHNFTLRAHMGYSPQVYYTGTSCTGISAIGTNGQDLFYPGIYVTV
jgi:hypothetical protein